MTTMNFPTMDGHFWVVRDGKIIDIDFQEYNMIRRIRNCKNKVVYLEADEITQRLMIATHLKIISNTLGGTPATAINVLGSYCEIKGIEPECYNCLVNSIMEIHKNGGELKFGSMGWEQKSGGVFYEFGGVDFKGIKAFLK